MDEKQQKFSFISAENVKWYRYFGKQFGSFLIGKYSLPYDKTVSLLGIYPTYMKTYVHTKTCKQMFTAALESLKN